MVFVPGPADQCQEHLRSRSSPCLVAPLVGSGVDYALENGSQRRYVHVNAFLTLCTLFVSLTPSVSDLCLHRSAFAPNTAPLPFLAVFR